MALFYLTKFSVVEIIFRTYLIPLNVNRHWYQLNDIENRDKRKEIKYSVKYIMYLVCKT